MIQFFRAAFNACVALAAVAGVADAAQVFFSGTATEANLDVPGNTSNWTLLVEYSPTTLPSIAAPVTSADFRINRGGSFYRWNVLKVASQNKIRIAGARTSYDLTLVFEDPTNAPAGSTTGTDQADIWLNVGGGATLVNQEASEANIALLTSTSTVVQGRFIIDDEFPFDTNGVLSLDGIPATAIPEPGSIALLSGLGLVAGRRVMARRRQQKANAEPETAA
jgi:hypothetical protein